MKLNELQKQEIINFIKNKMNKEFINFSKECNKHEQMGDFEHWLYYEAENESKDANNWIPEIQSQLNISNCEEEIKEIFKKYMIQRINKYQ
jgi:hypothetical protein